MKINLSYPFRAGVFTLILFVGPAMLSAQAETPDSEAIIPEAYPLERYEPLWKKSPFTLSSTVANAPGGFAENLILAGVIKIGDQSYVSILDKTTLQRELISKEPNKEGLQLLKLQSSPDLEKVIATLKKGNEIATIRYDLNFSKNNSPKTSESAVQNRPSTSPENTPETADPTTPPASFTPPVIRRPKVPSRPSSPNPSFIKAPTP